MTRRRIPIPRGPGDRCLAALQAAAILAFTPLVTPSPTVAQTPEQHYADWARPIFPPEEYAQRRARMLEMLRDAGGGVLLLPSSDGHTGGDTFRQLEDFWYFTGLEVPGSVLALDSGSGEATLFLPRRDPRFENPGRPNDFPGRPLGDDPDFVRSTGIAHTEDVARFPQALKTWAAARRTVRVDIGRTGAVGPVDPPLGGEISPAHTFVLYLRRHAPSLDVRNAFALVAHLRMRKTPREIAALRRTAAVTLDAIRTTAAAVRPGVDERTLQGIFEAACRRGGAQRMPFTPIIKSGPNSLWPWRILAAHYDRRNRTLRAGELVILDVGCEIDGYVSDVGRTFPVSGTLSPQQRAKLQMISAVSDAIIAAVRPGVTLARLRDVAYRAIPDDEERYMQAPIYFGHHIGMNAGDPALLDEPLAPGMVITVEPWYYNHDFGISVFVEDDIVITEDGAEVLTAALPHDPPPPQPGAP